MLGLPAGVFSDAARRLGLDVVTAQHGQAGSDVAQRDRQVDDSRVLRGQSPPVTYGEDPAVGELDVLGRVIGPGRCQHRTLPS